MTFACLETENRPPKTKISKNVNNNSTNSTVQQKQSAC
jgi:hypothetical protein